MLYSQRTSTSQDSVQSTATAQQPFRNASDLTRTCQKCRSLWHSLVSTRCIADNLPLGMERQPTFVHEAPYAEPLSSCRLLSLVTMGVPMAMLMLVIMVVSSTVLMTMLGVVITFCHGMPMIMVAMVVIMFVIMIVIMTVIMTVTVLTHFAVLWVVLNAWCWL